MIFPAAYDSVNIFPIPLLCIYCGLRGKSSLTLPSISGKALTLLKGSFAFPVQSPYVDAGVCLQNCCSSFSLSVLPCFQFYGIILTVPGQVREQWEYWLCEGC